MTGTFAPPAAATGPTVAFESIDGPPPGVFQKLVHTIAWVWDVYDAEKRRAMRITGEEKVGQAGRDAWMAADDRALRAIARTGVTELARFFANPGRDQPGPGPADSPLTVAAMGGPAVPVPNR